MLKFRLRCLTLLHKKKNYATQNARWTFELENISPYEGSETTTTTTTDREIRTDENYDFSIDYTQAGPSKREKLY